MAKSSMIKTLGLVHALSRDSPLRSAWPPARSPTRRRSWSTPRCNRGGGRPRLGDYGLAHTDRPWRMTDSDASMKLARSRTWAAGTLGL